MWCVNQDIWNIFQTFVKYRYIFFFIFHKYFSSKILSAILKRHVYYNLKSKRYFLKTWSKPFLNSYFTIKSLTSSQKKKWFSLQARTFCFQFQPWRHLQTQGWLFGLFVWRNNNLCGLFNREISIYCT